MSRRLGLEREDKVRGGEEGEGWAEIRYGKNNKK